MTHFLYVTMVVLSFRLLGISTKVVAPTIPDIINETFHQIFTSNMCNTKCKSRQFTLCDDYDELMENCSFDDVQILSDKEMEDLHLKEDLILGHNGLRDRIATRMKIANMLFVNWDEKLKNMARNYANLCQPFQDDECTTMGDQLTLSKAFDYYAHKSYPEQYTAMNRVCIAAYFLPNKFVSIALNIWYMNKNKLNAPVISKSQFGSYGTLIGENNFTHLAYPLTYRFGCSIVRYEFLFCLICFYYPYYVNTNGTMIYLHDKPASSCPNEYPMEDINFPAVCSTNLFKTSDSILAAPCFTLHCVLSVLLMHLF